MVLIARHYHAVVNGTLYISIEASMRLSRTIPLLYTGTDFAWDTWGPGPPVKGTHENSLTFFK